MGKRNAIQVKSEIIGMDVRIGVVEHSLLQVNTFKAQTLKKFSLKSQPGLFCPSSRSTSQGRMKDRESKQRHLTQAVKEESKAWQQKELMI